MSPGAPSPAPPRRCTAIVPAYLAEATLGATLDGLLHDNADAVERVIVVTSPGDESASLAAARADVDVIASSTRLSAGAARNLGRRCAADAELLLFVDADCRAEPGAVARMIDSLAGRRLAAVGAVIACGGGGAIAWLRHLLEFKEAASEEAGPWPWMLPTAALLCRADVFDALGGFPDMWPGEDLVFCHRMFAAGHPVAKVVAAKFHHRHPRGLRRMLRHEYLLGATSARARKLTGMHGSAFVRRPWLAPALLAGRAGRAALWLARHRRSELPLLALLSPLYVIALAAWTAGFTREARAGAIGAR